MRFFLILAERGGIGSVRFLRGLEGALVAILTRTRKLGLGMPFINEYQGYLNDMGHSRLFLWARSRYLGTGRCKGMEHPYTQTSSTPGQ